MRALFRRLTKNSVPPSSSCSRTFPSHSLPASVVGSHEHEGALRPATLSAVLKDVGTYGGYIGVPKGTDLSLKSADDAEMVSIRFQTVFLPVECVNQCVPSLFVPPDDASRSESALAAREFVTEAYNYQTRDASDPRNLLLLCTTQGTSVAADAPGAQKLWVHALGPDGSTVHRYWLEGERSSHKVGGAQAESAEEAAAAAARGKGTAAVIGTRQMGTRFNVLMTIQVPLVQAPPKRGLGAGGLPPWGLSLPFGGSLCGAAASPAPAACFGGGFFGAAAPMPPACPAPSSASSFGMPAASSKSFSFTPPAGAASSRRASVGPPPPPPRVGTACAARLSRGAHAGTAPRLACGSIARDVTQRASVTVVLYAAVSGGVPSEADVAAAVDDMEALYAACAAAGSRASEPGVQFANKPLTLDDMANISAKIITQPYKPPGQLVAGGGLFPM